MKRIYFLFFLVFAVTASSVTIGKAENNLGYLTREDVNELLGYHPSNTLTYEEMEILNDNMASILELTSKEDAVQRVKDIGLENKVIIEDITEYEARNDVAQTQSSVFYPPGAFSVDFINKSSTDTFFYVTLYAVNNTAFTIIQLAGYVDYYVKPVNAPDWILSYSNYHNEAGFSPGFERYIHNYAYSYPPGGNAKYEGRFVMVDQYGNAYKMYPTKEHLKL